ALLPPDYDRNEHRQAFEAFWLSAPDLEYFLVRNDFNEPVAQDVRRHPEGAHLIFRPDALLDRRVDRALMDKGPAGRLDDDDLFGVLGVGLVVAGTQLSYLAGTARYRVLVAAHAARRVIHRPQPL